MSFPGLSSSGNWVLGEHTVPGGPWILITSPVQPFGFLGAPRENCLGCAMCLLWEADFRLQQSWGCDCSSPVPSSSGCCTSASLPQGRGRALYTVFGIHSIILFCEWVCQISLSCIRAFPGIVLFCFIFWSFSLSLGLGCYLLLAPSDCPQGSQAQSLS